MARGRACPAVLGLGLLPLASPACLRGEETWRLLYEKDGFKAYENKGSPVAYKAEGVVGVDILELAAVLVDVPRRPEWVHRLAENRVLEGDPCARHTAYVRYDLPWPARDRDVVIETDVQVDEVKGVVTARFANVTSPLAPVRPDCERVPLCDGAFTLRDTGQGSVHVTYTVRLDPGGWLPAWIVRLFVRDAPAATLRAFRAQVLKTRGQYEAFMAPYRARRKPPGP